LGRPRPRAPVLIVDDDGETRARLAAGVTRAGFDIREASTGEEAVEIAEAETPALVILDVCLPGISGYEVCHALRQRFGAGLPIVFVSAARTESYDRVAALLIGGDDYLVKPVAPDELAIRIERLAERAAPVVPEIARKLTARELDVLRLLAEGRDVGEMGSLLFISPKTVNTHIDHILQKLGVHSRAQAVALAYRRNLVETPV
jgi:DNA-binding NarL/FixJ family response regulator